MATISTQDSRWHRLVTVFILGFFSGLPLLLVGGTLKLWLANENIDVKTIGLFGLVGLPYTFKFLVAPLLDAYYLRGLGRRRTWLLVTQVGLTGSLFWQSLQVTTGSLQIFALAAFVVAIFSALQDTVIDAYKREILPENELGIGSSVGVYGYRIAMLVAGGLATSLVDPVTWGLSWPEVYRGMAGLMALGIVYTLLGLKEPQVGELKDRTLMEGFIQPFLEFLRRDGAWLILLFVFTFKLGDAIAGGLLSKYYVDLGFTNLEIGLIAKTWGLASSLLGLFVGGMVILRFGTYSVLYASGILQGLSTMSFGLLTLIGPSLPLFAFCIVFEDVATGIGTSAFVAYMARLTDRNYTATQFAALSSIASLGRALIGAYGGYAQELVGWTVFFTICGLLSGVGLFLLQFYKRKLFPDLA